MTKNLETREMERGKPHEWETQILVGESFRKESNDRKDRKVDKYLSRKFLRTEHGL